MKAVVVARGLVSEERSKVVSGCIGSGGSGVRDPNAAWCTTLPARETGITAPGNAPASTPWRSRSSAAAKSTSDDGRLERGEPAVLGIDGDPHAERQRVVPAFPGRGIVPGGNPDAHGIRRVGEELAHDVEWMHARHPAARSHRPEHDPRETVELPGLPELREQAIDTIRELVGVL